MAEDNITFPPIEPTTFDLIVIGTGLHESIIAAAAAAAGKTVLHLDPNHFYGSHFASLPIHDLTSFLISNSDQNPSPSPTPLLTPSDDLSSFSVLNLTTRPLYSAVDISAKELEDSRKFSIDLAGPRVLFCADSVVDLLLKSNANQYMEFKNIDACLIYEENGVLRNVPDSRSAIFKDTTLDWKEKNQLMKFFKLVQQHFDSAESSEKISEEDLASPFAAFLNKKLLPPKMKSIILYAIAMADYVQDCIEVNTEVLKTEDGINRLALYHSSVGRFPNALGALIYPIYGQGELPQAFCRRAAVKGCLYVLRMPVTALLLDKVTESYKGVKLSSGQELFSQKIVLDPSFTVPSTTANSSIHILGDSSLVFGPKNVKQKVARGICITRTPLKPNVSSCLVVYPPRSLYPEQVASLRVLQLASNIAVCPSGMFIFYISALCDDAIEGKRLLNAAVEALFTSPNISPEIISTDEIISTEQKENVEEVEPVLLWHAFYVQELTMGSVGSICSMPMPDVNLNYNDAIDATAKFFQILYPDEELFPEIISADTPEDNDVADTELL